MWEPVLAAISTLLVGLIAVFHKGLTEWIKQKFDRAGTVKREVINGLRQLHEMHQCFSEIMELERADRVLIFAGMNSGGLPRIDSPFYCQAIHGDTKGSTEVDPVERYSVKRKMDRWYIETLLKMEKEGKVVLDFETMPDSKLKGYYADEGVKHSVMWFIGVIEKKFMYLSIATYKPEPFTSRDLMLMDLQIDRLKAILNDSM